jgi:hypothetical protein
MKRLLIAVLGLVAAACGENGTTPRVAQVAKWERFEVRLDRPVIESNPFDPAAIAVSGEFRSPTGELVVTPGFVSRAYQRQLVSDQEQLAPAGDLSWTIRFTPTAEGTWSWRSRIETPRGVEQSDWQPLQVGPAAPAAHGFLRRSARDDRYLAFDDGASFSAVGENLGWYDSRGTFAYDRWIERLAAQGCTFIRVWMPSWAFGLEWITRGTDGSVSSSTLGNYGARLDRAWQLDYVIDLARQHGIMVMLSIQNHGPFSLTSNSEWSDNPYNAANGGPLKSPRDFFTSDEAVQLFKRRLRYIVARWGYATNLLAWELWNEVDLTDQPVGDALVAWHQEMAHELRGLDSNQHLVTTSAATASRINALWALDEIELAQVHVYAFDSVTVDFSKTLPELAAHLRHFGKPVLVAEAGVDFRGPTETLAVDPNGDGFHDLLWAPLFANTFGSGMTWWWDNVIDPQDWYFHLGPLARLVAGVDFAAEGFVTGTLGTEAAGRPISIFVLQGQQTVLVWLKNAAHQYYTPDPTLVQGAVITLDGLPDATWHATWLDTRSGERTAPATIVSANSRLTIDAPAFRYDSALRLDRRS